MRITTLVAALLIAIPAFAVKVKDHEYPDTLTVGEQKLTLNGAGLRQVRRFGMNFDVHTAALYTKAPVTDGKALIDSNDLRVLKYTYLRSVSKSQVNDATEEMFADTCKQVIEEAKCPAVKAELKKLNDQRPDVKDGSTTDYYYYADHVDYDLKGKTSAKGTLQGADVVKVMLGMTFGPKPGSEELKAALLKGGAPAPAK